MKVWYSKNLGDAMLAIEPLTHIEKIFLSEYAKANDSVEMALFTRHEMHGDLHCELIIYLSPAARIVAAAVGAEPCDGPSMEGLSLLAGSEEFRQLHFPERVS